MGRPQVPDGREVSDVLNGRSGSGPVASKQHMGTLLIPPLIQRSYIGRYLVSYRYYVHHCTRCSSSTGTTGGYWSNVGASTEARVTGYYSYYYRHRQDRESVPAMDGVK